MANCVLSVFNKENDDDDDDWNFTFSDVFKLNAGVRQGGVLSPCFFALFIDDVIEYVHSQNVGCMYNLVNASIILYMRMIAILLLSTSVQSLQQLLSACEAKLR